MILLDTSVLISPPNSWPNDTLGASIVALGALRGLLSWLPFDEYAAESYGLLAAEVTRTRPSHARSEDLLMAAHAHSLGVPLMTRNAKDFELVGNLVEIIAVD